MKRKLLSAGILGVCCSLALASTGCNQTAQEGEYNSGDYLFTIDEDRFDLAEARIIFMTYQCMNENVYLDILGDSFWEKKISEDVEFSEYIKEYCVLPELVCVKTLCMMAQEQEYTIPEEVEPYIEAATNQYYYSLSDAEKQYMPMVDYNTVKKTYEDYFTAHVMMKQFSSGVDSEVSDDEARVAIIRQIYMKDAEKAREAYDFLTIEKKAFDDVFTSYNCLMPNENEKDSEENAINYLTIARGENSKEYEDLVFALRDGDISSVFEYNGGYAIVYMYDAYEENLTNVKKEQIIQERIYDAWYDDYKDYIDSKSTQLNTLAYNSIPFSVSEGVENDTFFTVYDSYLSDFEQK